ncbi:MAG: GGDEF domain-containing protein [Oleiphilaceae bacterium]|nr:GGDEF domain-containing protein [Oleiphilaceae bacterium]
MPLHAWRRYLLLSLLSMSLLSALTPASLAAEADCRGNEPGKTLPVTDSKARSELLNYVCYFTAKAGKPAADAQTPAQIETGTDWQSTNGQDLVFSHSSDTYWFSLRVHNPSDEPGLWYLAVNYSSLDHISFWVDDREAGPTIKTGDQADFFSRPVDYRYFLVPVLLEPDEGKTLTVKLRSAGAINVPITLQNADSLIADSNRLTLTNGIFYGALMILSVFNLLLFFISRQPYYFYNSFYMSSMGLFLFAMGGFAFQYFWPSSPWLANVSIPLLEALGTLAMLLFGRSFLDISERQRRVSRLLTGFAVISVVLLGLAFVLPYAQAIRLNTLFGLFVIGFLLFLGVLRWHQGYTPAKWYVLSWSAMVVGTCVYVLSAFGYLGNFVAKEVMMQTGVVGQVLLLNYAMVYRWQMLSDRMLAVEHNAKQELESKVRERTSQLNKTMGELEQVNRQLAEISTKDSLTGLYNRRHLDATLPRLCAESRRNGVPMAMVIFDADHFKTINDRWGHAFGDECLQAIAGVLERHTRRPRDLAVRFGGEEFALLLPETDAAGACTVSRRILVDMTSIGLMAPGQEAVTISLSAGVGTLGPNDDDKDLFRKADEALYRAKAQGRNRVECNSADTRS